MKILAIETSCDDTAISIVEMKGDNLPTFTVLAHLVSSQTKIHAEFGGVVPNLAKREHSKNIVPLIIEALTKTGLDTSNSNKISDDKILKIKEILSHSTDLTDLFLSTIPTNPPKDIDAIAVTEGPGLEPALWVGINVAEALAVLWSKPLIPVNHLEGHLVSSLIDEPDISLPALGLVISGGHTEMILIKAWGQYEKIGSTRDDACGEAFDKVARLLDLPYPGGPKISELAKLAREQNIIEPNFNLPRPMIKSNDYDFSFSGLKTAVRYALAKETIPLSDETKKAMARQFEDAVVEVLITKTKTALNNHQVKSLILGGGVVANEFLRQEMTKLITSNFPDLKLHLPDYNLATDNAVMIAIAALLQLKNKSLGTNFPSNQIKAQGNLSL